jgi:hypothetical protein
MTKARDIATSEVVTGEIGSTIQAHDDDLDSIAALDKTDGNVIVGDGANWVSESGATARTSLGLGTAATTASTDYATAAQGALASTALQPTGDGSGLTGIAGGFSNMDVFTSPGTWTNPGNVDKVKVTVVGGGGGGGGGSAGGSQGGDGGGGGGSAIEVIPFPSATNVTVTVGAGGGPRANIPLANSNGIAGGTSSFGAYCSATGGTGGRASEKSTYLSGGGTGSGGTINFTGGYGERKQPGTPNVGKVATGGSSLLAGRSTNNDANPVTTKTGLNYGGGGSGAGNSIGSGGGAPGVVIVEY